MGVATCNWNTSFPIISLLIWWSLKLGNGIENLYKWSCSIDCHARIWQKKKNNNNNKHPSCSKPRPAQMMSLSLVAMTGLEKCCIYNSCISTVVILLRWAIHGPWASCSDMTSPIFWGKLRGGVCKMSSGQPRILDHQCSSLLSSTINCIFFQNIQFINGYVPLLFPAFTPTANIHQYLHTKNQAMLTAVSFTKLSVKILICT